MKNLTHFWTFIRRQPSEQNYIKISFVVFELFLIDSQLFIAYSWFLVFVQALRFYFNVVISYLFNFIFETDLFYVSALIKVS